MSSVPNPAAPLPESVIEAGRSSRRYWLDLWHYRELFAILAWRDIKVRYRQAALGFAWAVIQPLATTFILTYVFSRIAHMAAGRAPYPMVVLAGLMPWMLFSSGLSGAGASLVSNANLISKVYFPRMIPPMAALAVAFVDFAVTLLVYAGFALWYGVFPSWRIVFLPGFIAIALTLAFGAGLWLTALTVKYRDFRFIVPFLLQFGLLATPVGYRTDVLHTWAGLLDLNPLTGVINGFRWCLIAGDSQLTGLSILASVLGAGALLGSGVWYFRHMERAFADII